MTQLVNQIRFYHYIIGVLTHQQTDPFCSICKAYSNTVSALRDGLASLSNELDGELSSLSTETGHLLEEARKRIASIYLPENAEGQKKAGNCQMPEGVCFIKSSKAILTKI